MANGDNIVDMADLIRRRDMLQGLPNFAPDQQIQSAQAPQIQPSQIQPSQAQASPQDTGQFSPLLGSDRYTPAQYTQPPPLQVPFASPQIPDPTQAQAAGRQLLGAVGTGPPVGSQFKTNKALAGVLGFLSLKNMLRNPVAWKQNLDYMDKPGYLGAVQDYDRRVEIAQQQYNINRDNLKDNLEVYRSQLGANKDAVEVWLKQAEMGMQPLKVQEVQANIAKGYAEAVKAGEPKDDRANPLILRLKDGTTTNAITRNYPDGRWEYLGPDGKPLDKSQVVDFRRLDDKSSLPDQYVQMAKDEAAAEGRPFTQRDLLKAIEDTGNAQHKAEIEAADRRAANLDRERLDRETRAGEARDIVKIVADDRKRLDLDSAPIAKELESLDRIRSLAAAGNVEGVGSMLKIGATESGLIGSGHSNYRINMQQINSLIESSGPVNTLMGRLQNWFSPGKGRVPDAVMKQIDNLLDRSKQALMKQQAIVDKYGERLDNISETDPNARAQIRGILTQYHREINGLPPQTEQQPTPGRSGLPAESDVNKALGIQ